MTLFPVLAGSYSPAGVGGVGGFRIDSTTGDCTRLWDMAGVAFPTYLALGAQPGRFYAVSETSHLGEPGPGTLPEQGGRPGQVWSLRSTGLQQRPEPFQPRPSGGDLPTHLRLDRTGRWLVVSNYGGPAVPGGFAVLPVQPDGSLGLAVQVTTHSGSGPVTQRQACAHVHSTIFTASNGHLVAADLGSDLLVVYRFDAASGQLAAASSLSMPGGWGPRYMVWSRNAGILYVVGELACEIAVLAFDEAQSVLRLVSRVSTLTVREGETLAADVHLSRDGQRLHVSNRGGRNSIATLAVAASGELSLVAETSSGGRWPRHFALTPDERMMVVANQHSGALSVLSLDAEGIPGSLVTEARMSDASFVAIGSDVATR